MRKIAFYLLLSLFISAGFPAQEVSPRNYSQEEQLILVGVGAFRDGFYDIAERQFSSFLKGYPDHPKAADIHYLLGKTLLLKGKLREAKTAFSKIVRNKKGFGSMDYVLFWLADIEIKLGRGEEARKILLSVVRRFPTFEWIDSSYYLLGLLDLGLNHPASAQTSFKKVAQLSRDRDLIRSSFFWLGVLSFRQEDFEAAANFFRKASDDPQSGPEAYLRYALFWLGETHLKLEKFNEAKQNFKTFHEHFTVDPFGDEVHWRIGFCEYRLGNLQESVEILQTLKNKSVAPDLLLRTHSLLGEIFLVLGDHPSSIKEINVFLNQPQGSKLSGASLLTLFWNLVHLGEMEAAFKVSQRLQKLSHFEDENIFLQWLNAELSFSEGRIPDALPYYFNIVNTGFRERALVQIGKGYFYEKKFKEAITNFDILFLEFPNSTYTEACLFMKAECLNLSGNQDHALETYDRVARPNSHSLWRLFALTEMGNLSLSRHETKEAEFAFRKVLNDFPDHPLSCLAAFHLGHLQFRKNNMAEAVQYYSSVLRGKLLELFGEVHFRLGEMFYLQGRYEKAFDSFEAAISCLKDSSPWFFLTHLEMGNLQRKWGKYEEAKKAYTIILNRSRDEEIKGAAKILLKHLESH